MAADPTDDQLFSLKTLFRYLREHTSGGVRTADRIAANQGVSSDQVSYMLNRASGPRANRERYVALAPAIVAYFDELEEPMVPYVRSMVAQLRAPMGQVLDATSFSEDDPTSLRNWVSLGSKDVEAAICVLQGMWHIVRVSSTKWANPEIPEFNVGLLNVFPTAESKEGLPEFKLYAKGRNVEAPPQRHIGYLLVGQDRINFIGRREDNSGRHATLLTVQYHGGNEGSHYSFLDGQYSAPASNGVHVSAYLRARFIEKTDNLADSDFRQSKDLALSGIGVKTIEEIENFIKRERAEELLRWSRDDQVFDMQHAV